MDEAMNEVKVDKYIAKPFTADGLQARLGSLFDDMAANNKKSKGFFGKLAAALD
jgi:DNA-binding response OmpR family regulator